jgi:tRNA pseudouridine55 synthase
VTIHSFTIGAGPEPGVLAIEVSCSAGTYIRTLAADLGRLLGGGAHLRNLRRTAVGEFTLADAGPPDDCDLLPVATAVRTLTRIDVDTPTAALVANGRVLPAFDDTAGPWTLFSPLGDLIAVYERFQALDAKPAVVLPTANPA